jgi:hypothetical protein
MTTPDFPSITLKIFQGLRFNDKQHCITLYYTMLHYITLCYTALHHTTLHYTTQHYTTLHNTTQHYTTLHCTTLHYTTQHYTTLHDNVKHNRIAEIPTQSRINFHFHSLVCMLINSLIYSFFTSFLIYLQLLDILLCYGYCRQLLGSMDFLESMQLIHTGKEGRKEGK